MISNLRAAAYWAAVALTGLLALAPLTWPAGDPDALAQMLFWVYLLWAVKRARENRPLGPARFRRPAPGEEALSLGRALRAAAAHAHIPADEQRRLSRQAAAAFKKALNREKGRAAELHLDLALTLAELARRHDGPAARRAVRRLSLRHFELAGRARPGDGDLLGRFIEELTAAALAEDGPAARNYWREAVGRYPHLFKLRPGEAALHQAYGAALRRLAGVDDENRSDLLRASRGAFAEAVRLGGPEVERHFLWGEVALELARAEPNLDEHRFWLAEAEENFRQTTRLDRRHQAAWSRRGEVLAFKALDAAGAGRPRPQLWRRALTHYRKAAALGPDDLELRLLMGRACQEQASLAPPARRQAFLQEAADSFARAAALNPAQAPAENDWGLVLLDLADLEEEKADAGEEEDPDLSWLKPDESEDEEVDWFRDGGPSVVALRRSAAYHFSRAVRNNPHEADYWYNWGQTLEGLALNLGRTPEAALCLAEAAQKLQSASILAPGDGEVWTAWGRVLYLSASLADEARHGRRLLREAYHCCQEAVRLAPDYYLYWRNWSRVINVLARQTDDAAESQRLYAELEEKSRRADELENPKQHLTVN